MESAPSRRRILSDEEESHRKLLDRCKVFFSSVLADKDVDATKDFISRMLWDMPEFVARQMMQLVAENFDVFDPMAQREIGNSLLDQADSRLTVFDEQVWIIREKLADVYVRELQYTKVAEVLKGSALFYGASVDDKFKFEKFVLIARLYLETGGIVNEENFILLCHALPVFRWSEDFMTCEAEILDKKDDFLGVTELYYELSARLEPYYELSARLEHASGEDNRPEFLSSSIVCTILAEDCGDRSFYLECLFKDIRCKRMGDLFDVLDRVHHGRKLSEYDMNALGRILKPHQVPYCVAAELCSPPSPAPRPRRRSLVLPPTLSDKLRSLPSPRRKSYHVDELVAIRDSQLHNTYFLLSAIPNRAAEDESTSFRRSTRGLATEKPKEEKAEGDDEIEKSAIPNRAAEEESMSFRRSTRGPTTTVLSFSATEKPEDKEERAEGDDEIEKSAIPNREAALIEVAQEEEEAALIEVAPEEEE